MTSCFQVLFCFRVFTSNQSFGYFCFRGTNSGLLRLLAPGLSPFQSVKLALRISLLHGASMAPTNSDKLCFRFHLFKNILSFLLDFSPFCPCGVEMLLSSLYLLFTTGFQIVPMSAESELCGFPLM